LTFDKEKNKKVVYHLKKHKDDQMIHQHNFHIDKGHLERKTLLVVVITFITMLSDLFFGAISNSMALLADGIHMGTHVLALGITFIAYVLSRKLANNDRFTFGTWKIEILGAYSSALFLGLVALMMVYSSIERLLHPLAIHYDQALLVALIGLAVNILCALILDTQDHHDLNLKSAYIHVLADALTSLCAIVALLGAKYYALNWLDPVMGIIGALLILRWAIGLSKDSAHILLDYSPETQLSLEIQRLLESDQQTHIQDLHVWRISDKAYACIVSLRTKRKASITTYRKKLNTLKELAHITIEIEPT
jgi:cation diffusion facilitator family transporter